jgi:hypothetical protein
LVEEIGKDRFPTWLSSMSKITLMVGAVLSLSVAFVLLLIWRSAEGHEDEKGFHPGADDKLSDAQVSGGSKVEPSKVASLGVTAPIQTKR